MSEHGVLSEAQMSTACALTSILPWGLASLPPQKTPDWVSGYEAEGHLAIQTMQRPRDGGQYVAKDRPPADKLMTEPVGIRVALAG